jgi:hypothetical protein
VFGRGKCTKGILFQGGQEVWCFLVYSNDERDGDVDEE